MAPRNPRYLPKDTTPQSTLLSSFTVLRASDQETFVATIIPHKPTPDSPSVWAESSSPSAPKLLAPVLVSAAGVSISQILNHHNIVSLVDIIQTSQLPGSHVTAPSKRSMEVETPSDFTVWEDMNAGCLAQLLPSPNALPDFDDGPGWHLLASQNYQRFSLPEGLCWHVLLSVSRALLWLHHGIKETDGIRGEIKKHDDDWQPILIRDVSPGQVWFKHPAGKEHYGECKLGGFQWAKVTGCSGGTVAITEKKESASVEKQYYWAPEIYKNTHSWSRESEIWSLGAVVYTMMTGIPPPRYYEYSWQISRMADKGFSKGIRDIVALMLDHDVEKRPDALKLVRIGEEGGRYWRTSTQDGQEHMDVRDGYAIKAYQEAQLRSGKSSSLPLGEI